MCDYNAENQRKKKLNMTESLPPLENRDVP